MILAALLLAAQAANVPTLPDDIPKSADLYDVQLLEKQAGQMAVWSEDGKLRSFFQFNDRGRGPKTYETVVLDSSGLPVSEQVDGNDYMKDAVHETFAL